MIYVVPHQGAAVAKFARPSIVSIDDSEIIQAYAVIDAYGQRTGQPLGENDGWIAATASVTGARLLTTDKDFDRLDPLFLSRDWIDPVAK